MPSKTYSPFSFTGNAERAGIGLRSGIRMGQTAATVYPRVFRWILSRRRPTATEVREVFEELGVTYIKLGQFIASSPSFFPPEYVAAFEDCFDKTPTISFATIKQIVIDDLGRPLDEVYRSIDEEPLASASIAQVHAATLITGEDVVIKVQKPHVKTVLSTDMNTLYVMTKLFELLTPGVAEDAVSGLVEELHLTMVDECDFIQEAANLELFEQFLLDQDIREVVVPKVYPQASSTKVLTMQRMYGRAITDSTVLDGGGEVPITALFAAMNTWFKSLSDCSVFHADLHGGNMLLLDDGRVAFIDWGMVGRIDKSTWQAAFSLIEGLASADFAKMASAMAAVGMASEAIDEVKLSADIQQLYERLYQLEDMLDPVSGGDVVTKFMSELAELGKTYGIRFPRAFTLLLKQFMYFDRYLQVLVPDANLFTDQRIAINGM